MYNLYVIDNLKRGKVVTVLVSNKLTFIKFAIWI